MIVLWPEVEVPAFWSLSHADTVAIIARTGAQEVTKLAINTTNTKIVGADGWMVSLFYTMAWSRTLPHSTERGADEKM